jgi:hypothetical protein
VLRSQINAAEYNPRSISEYARKQLATSLEKFGLVETLVWNERTSALVGGHQRLAEIDKQNAYPPADYSLEVSVVNLSVRRERELNVWLNNRSAQGQFDKNLFAKFLEDMPEMTLDDLGMTGADLDFEFGDTGVFDSIFQRENKAAESVAQSAEEIAAHRKEVRDKRTREENRQDTAPEADADYYLMVVFDSARAKEDWLKANGFPNTARFLSHREMEAAMQKVVA